MNESRGLRPGKRNNTRAAKLTPEQVYAIRCEYSAGTTQRALAHLYNVSTETIGRIVRGDTWRQFDNPAERARVDLEASAPPRGVDGTAPGSMEEGLALARKFGIAEPSDERKQEIADKFSSALSKVVTEARAQNAVDRWFENTPPKETEK